MRKAGTAIIYLCAAAGFLCLLALLLTIGGGLAASLAKIPFPDALSAFSTIWDPQNNQYGVLPMIAGTAVTAFIATIIASIFAFGLLGCIWIYDNRFSRFLRGLLRFMAGIPTVIYAFCGIFLLLPFFRAFWGGTGFGMLAVSLVLALLVLPTVTLMMDAAVQPLMSKPEALLLHSTALGIPRETALIKIAVYSQRNAVVSAIIIGFSRAMGDTMIALMLSGNAPITPDGLMAPLRTLPAHINLLSATEITSQVEFTLFLSGALLFGAAFGLNMLARRLRRRQAL